MPQQKPRGRQQVRMTADRAEMLKKSKVQAGKPKAAGSSRASTITRQMQNKGVKDGTIKLGRSGKSYNVYDAASGTWKKGVVTAAGRKKVTPPKKATEGPKKSSPSTTRSGRGWGWHEPMMYYYEPPQKRYKK